MPDLDIPSLRPTRRPTGRQQLADMHTDARNPARDRKIVDPGCEPSRPPIRVAHCIHGLGLGGAQQVIRHLVGGSDRAAFRHWVYTPEAGVFRAPIEAAGAHVRIIERRLPKLDPFHVFDLARAMRADAIDVVHTHLFGDSLHGVLAARLAGRRPVVMTLHIGAEGPTPLQRRGYRWLLRRTAHNVACCESVGRSWRAAEGIVLDVIPNAIAAAAGPAPDAATRAGLKARLGLDPDAPIVAGVGRLVEQKGFDLLISAFARLDRPSRGATRLVLLGEGPLRKALEDHARREGVGERVLFAGVRPDARELMPAFDVLAFGSAFEGLPMALLEGMAAGCCIVGTDAPGILDAVTHEREGLIVPAGDVLRLQAALEQVLGNHALREQLGSSAHQRFLREFTADRLVARYEDAYRSVHRSDLGVQSRAIH
jgi:glycosyltransferase involved in cell wall biosynthesis